MPSLSSPTPSFFFSMPALNPGSKSFASFTFDPGVTRNGSMNRAIRFVISALMCGDLLGRRCTKISCYRRPAPRPIRHAMRTRRRSYRIGRRHGRSCDRHPLLTVGTHGPSLSPCSPCCSCSPYSCSACCSCSLCCASRFSGTRPLVRRVLGAEGGARSTPETGGRRGRRARRPRRPLEALDELCGEVGVVQLHGCQAFSQEDRGLTSVCGV